MTERDVEATSDFTGAVIVQVTAGYMTGNDTGHYRAGIKKRAGAFIVQGISCLAQ